MRPQKGVRGATLAALLAGSPFGCDDDHAPGASADAGLTGRAVLAADTFADGPASGAYIGGDTNGRTRPFAKQPVQGFSALLRKANGTYLVLADNGYGTLENSADFNLRVYRIRRHFKTAAGGHWRSSTDPGHQQRRSLQP